MPMTEERAAKIVGWAVGSLIAWLVFGIIFLLLLWQPLVGPWKAQRLGYAEVLRAGQNRQILVTQAQAEKEAAVARADAIRIVGEMSKAYPEYREQEFIGAFADALKEGKISQMIYVPTEANIPIIERK